MPEKQMLVTFHLPLLAGAFVEAAQALVRHYPDVQWGNPTTTMGTPMNEVVEVWVEEASESDGPGEAPEAL